MATYTYLAIDPSGETRNFHLQEHATDSDLINALQETFPEHDFQQSEVTGREGRFKVQLPNEEVVDVVRQGRRDQE